MSRFVLTAQLQLQAPNNVRQIVQQIQSQLNGVNVNVQVQNSAQAQRQLQQITQHTNQATTAAERMGRAFSLSVRRFAAFSVATRAVGLFTSTLGNAVQDAIDFERQLVKVAQVTGQTIGQLRGLTRQINSLSTGLGVSSSDLLEVSTVLAQAGLSAEDTAVALRTLAKAALAPNFDSISETAEGAIAILAQFQEGVGALEKQLGSINAVAGAFAVEASDLIDVIRRTGGVFKASGGDLNELLALFTSVRATTRESAESIGTGLRTIFTRIQRPKTIEFLKQFGVELVDLNGKFVGPFEAIKRLSEALSGLGEGDLTFISIAEELGGFRQIGKVLPLLQQFSTAQSALNVAMKAGDSLTQDAASAQAALAVRIMKVKEEFLALIRSMTETSTFQIMANTALSLASALIKIADSIKPLLPMLAALAAVRLTRGIGGFFGGIMSGATSGRTYNKGGKVLGFARGGLVPGSGNRDTVPAMLSPGEFVIRKSSVNKMGAGTLAAMNENRYAYGGPVGWSGKTFGIAALEGSERSRTETIPTSLIQEKLKLKGKNKQEDTSINQAIRGILGLKGAEGLKLEGKADTLTLNDPTIKDTIYKNIESNIYGLITSSATKIGDSIGVPMRRRPINPNKVLQKIGTDSAIGSIFEGALSLLGSPFVSGKSTEALDFPKGIGRLGPAFKNIIGMPVDAKKTVDTKRMGELLFTKAPNFFANFVRRSPQYTSLVSQLGQGRLDKLRGKPFTLDEFKRVTGNSRAKISDIEQVADPTGGSSMGSKLFTLRKNLGGLIQKFATGGGVGTDTVPALLTPGEFVVNRSSAQRIGYGNLNRMNKIGKYANGGVVGVKKFFRGGVAEKDVARAQGSVLNSISEAEQIFGSLLGEMAPAIKKAILDGWKGIKEIKATDVSSTGKTREHTRGLATGSSAMGFQIKGKKAAATTETVAHETGHLADFALGGKKGYASASKGTFQFDLVEKVKPQMEAAFKAAGKSADEIKDYLSSNVELFAEFYAKASPEVRAILTSTTDSKVGMQKLADSLGNAGYTYAGLEASDLGVAPKTKAAATAASGTPTPSGGGGPPIPPSKKPSSSSTSQPKGGGGGSPPTNATPTTATVTAAGGTGGNMGGLFNDFGANVAAVSAALSTMLPPLDENSGALTKIAHNFLSLTTTIGGVAFALGQFGIQLKAANVASFAKSLFSVGKGGLGAKLGGFTSQGRVKGTSFTENFNLVNARSERAAQLKDLRLRMQQGGGSVRRNARKQLTNLQNNPLAKFDTSSLTGRLGSMLGKRAATGGIGGRLAGMAGQGIMRIGGIGAATGLGGIGGMAAAASGPALAVVGAVAAINSVIGSFRDLDDKLKDSIAAGKVEEASRLAVAQKASEFPLIGNIVSSIFGEAGDAFLLGFGELFGGPSIESVKQLASAQAGAVRTQKALEDAQKTATKAMEDFKNGSISASDALAQIRSKTAEVSTQQKRASDFAKTNMQQRGGLSRDIFTLGGLLGESSTARNKRLSGENVEQINKASQFQAEAFNIETEARQATIRSGIARGKNIEDIRSQALGTGTKNDLSAQRQEALQMARRAAASGDDKTYDAAMAQAKQLGDQIEQVNREVENIEKAVKRAKESFEAMNLGLRSAQATSSALSASMTRFSEGFEVGGMSVISDVKFLQEAMGSAAQAMDPKQIKEATANVAKNLRESGVSPGMVTKFEGNVNAFTQAQAGYNKAFENVKKSMAEADFQNLSPDELKKRMADELTKGLGPDVSAEAKENLKKAIGGMDLTDEDVDKILGGNLGVFGEKLGEEQKKMFEPIMKIMQERAAAEQVLIDFTKKRIDAERNLVAAQQEALDLQMEGREVQAKYGGPAVSINERRANLLARSNVEGGRKDVGLTAMKTGSIEELRQRNAEIRTKFAGIESRREQRGGMDKTSGAIADETQKDLQKAYKTQIDTIRGLIKLEEEQLKITQEKNKLEKESMESLIKGDVESFFKQQAAVGATAAIASGDQRLMNMYGADALGMAYQDIQRQQDAGVQELYGQRLGGAGGLTEAAAGAALSSRGVTDMRAAQVMAGTTAEEEASKSRLRELGGMLGETGELGVDLAEMQVNTAQVNLTAAQVTFDNVTAQGQAAAAQANAAESMPAAMSRGGAVYASRGIFVPRGTDTVPAMLTPGEFVVNRGAVQRGNNLQILQAMNGGLGVSSNGNASGAAMMARGGMVRYRQDGSTMPESSSNDAMTQFAQSLNEFNSKLLENINKLNQTNISIKLDSTAVSINLNDGGLLKALTGQVKSELFKLIESEFKVDDGGRLRRNSSILG